MSKAEQAELPLIQEVVYTRTSEDTTLTLPDNVISLLTPLNFLLDEGENITQILSGMPPLMYCARYNLITPDTEVDENVQREISMFSLSFKSGPKLVFMIPNRIGASEPVIKSSKLAYPSAFTFLEIAKQLGCVTNHSAILISAMVDPVHLDGLDVRHSRTSVKAGVVAQEMAFVTTDFAPYIKKFIDVITAIGRTLGNINAKHIKQSDFNNYLLQVKQLYTA